jgi:3-phenylpropionate/trans-cinnamate dioxygenase ferredoxin reductase component
VSGNGLLVIGSSQAGVQLVVTLRALGHDGPITLLGDENHRPY